MDITLVKQIAAVLLVGFVVLSSARVSRSAHEKEYGIPTMTEKLKTFSFFIAWLVVLSVIAYINSWYLPGFLALFIIGFIPVGAGEPGVWRDIRDMGFLALIMVLPIVFIRSYGFTT